MSPSSFSKHQRFSLIFPILFSLFILSVLNSFSQSSESITGEEVVLRAAPFNGHFYTPTADWILQKMNTPSQSLIGDDPCSTISVTYTGFTPDAQAAFQAAVDIWETVLTGTVNITIDANWVVLAPNVLGSTGTLSEKDFPGAPSTDYYAASLANQIAGFDISPGSFDMTMNFNSIFDWYLGTDGNPAFDEYDLVTVTLHEIGHGLGFSSSKSYNSGTGVGSFGVGATSIPKNYDRFLTLGSFGTDLLDLSGTTLGDAFTSNNVYNNAPLAVAANGGVAPKMYAPATYAGGSTLSHWDEATYPAGNPHSLMTPAAGAGEAIHNPGELTIGLLEDLGWTICYGEPALCQGTYQYQGADLTGTDQIMTLAACNLMGDYSPATNATIGDQYTFTSTDNDGVEPIYITVRSGTFDGPVIGAGYSPLTVTSDVNGTIYPMFNSDALCGLISVGCFTSTVECISCPHYCEELDMVEGDPCDDGDPDSIDDVITADCVCQGIQPCLNTIPYITRVFDGSNQVFGTVCTYEQEYNTFENAELGSTYTFTSEAGGEGGFITVRSGTFDGAVLGFGYSPLTVVSDIDGSLFAHYNVDGACATASGYCVSISGQCISCPVYCPDLGLAVGSPCDDGNPSTINDTVTSECECYGEQPCETGSVFAIRTFDGTDVVIFGSSCNYESEYNAYENAETGNQYTFTSTDDGYPGFITVRSGTSDGPVLGFGFSPVTVTSDIDGTLYPHYTINGNCDTEYGNCVTTTGQCISCPHYCEELDMVEGDPCDDADPDTNYDMITAECECAGNLPCTPDYEYGEVTMTGTNQVLSVTVCNFMGDYNEILNVTNGDQYTFVSNDNDSDTPIYITVRSGAFDGPVIGDGYSPLTVTSDIDGSIFTGFTSNEFCDENGIGCFTSTVQCITCPVYCDELGLAVGDACDDGNPDTENDTVTPGCTCQGVYTAPANDLCANAELLVVNQPGECPDNEIIGTTLGATDDFGDYSCDSSGPWPDVFYTFNSGSFSSVNIDIFTITQTDMVIGVSEECGSDDLLCWIGGLSGNISVIPNTNYFIRVAPNLTYGDPGTFSICLSGVYDCPLIPANIGDVCDDGNPDTEDDIVTADCDCIGTNIYDCPDLSANIGDACDDGNPDTENDMITPGCICAGALIIPDNDLCENAESIDVNLPGDCAGNEIIGTTLGATSDGLDVLCEAANPDVFYSFNSGDYNTVLFNISTISATVLVFTLIEGGCDGEMVYCDFAGDLEVDVLPNTDYHVRISTNTAFGDPGTFSLCIEGVYDCPLLSANIGDACDDGNPNTVNDFVTAECNCEGTPIPPAVASLLTLPCGGQVIQITDAQSGPNGGGTATSDTRTIYAFAPDGGGPVPTYAGSAWPYVIISGALLIDPPISAALTTNVGGVLLVNGWPAYQFIGDGSPADANGPGGPWSYFLQNGDQSQDACPPVWDCPILEANIGDACDDGNPDTDNDTVTPDCICQGDYPAPANDLCANAEELSVYQPGECPDNQTLGTTLGANDEFGAFVCDQFDGPWPDVFYTFNSGDFNNVFIDITLIDMTDLVVGVDEVCGGDNIECGVGGLFSSISVTPNTDYYVRVAPNLFYGDPGDFNICISGVYDCPILSANIGDACDDGNPNTIDDTVTPDCDCVGTPTSASLTGTGSWNSDCGPRDMTIDFYSPGTDVLEISYSTLISAAGTFSIAEIPVGTFDIYIKIDGYLADGYLGYVLIDGPNNLLMVSPIPGDLNGDNGVNIVDLSVVNGAFGSTTGAPNFNPLADMNCDGGVNIIDVSILNGSFGLTGDNPPVP